MTLTAGSTLQSNKYLIQAVLNQSDFGVTYQAKHAFLEQSIFLQTFNPVVQQRSDFAELRRQFFSGVRSLSQRSDVLRVLDCFEEEGLPYVVLQALPHQAPPQLGDWLTLTLDPVDAPSQPDETASVVQPAESSAPHPPEPATPEPAPPESVAVEKIPAATVSPKLPVVSPVAKAQEIRLPQIAVESLNGNGRSLQIAKPQRRIPLALLITALAGLGLGAGAGFALRYHPAHGAAVSSSVPMLFGSQQEFPIQGDWPITEIPNVLSPEPKVEEPLYRTAPVPSYYTPPDYPPLPQPDRAVYPSSVYPNSVPSAPAPEIEPLPEVEPNPSSVIPQQPQPSAPFEPPNQTIDAPPDTANSAPTFPELLPPIATPAPTNNPPAAAPPAARLPKALPTHQPPILSQ